MLPGGCSQLNCFVSSNDNENQQDIELALPDFSKVNFSHLITQESGNTDSLHLRHHMILQLAYQSVPTQLNKKACMGLTLRLTSGHSLYNVEVNIKLLREVLPAP